MTWETIKQRFHIVNDARAEWRKFSTWITAIAMTVWGAFAAFPSLAVDAWNSLPQDLRGSIPHQDWIAAGCLAAVLIAKFVKQNKPQDSANAE